MGSLLNIILLLTLSTVSASRSPATSQAELYWRDHLPSTPIPLETRKLLRPDNSYQFNESPSLAHEQGLGYVYIKSRGPNVKAVPIFLHESAVYNDWKIKLLITKASAARTPFISRRRSAELLFSSKNISRILGLLSIPPGSVAADITKKTLTDFELPPLKGERKSCITSLKSMIDFVGNIRQSKNIKIVTTLMGKEGAVDQLQNYTVLGLYLLGSGPAIACHRRAYSYAVFFCHAAVPTQVYDTHTVGDNEIQYSVIDVP